MVPKKADCGPYHMITTPHPIKELVFQILNSLDTLVLITILFIFLFNFLSARKQQQTLFRFATLFIFYVVNIKSLFLKREIVTPL